jgi:hypothetical protein
VRLWTRIYTAGLPAESAARRRLEVDSDLWELQSDPHPGMLPAVQVFARLLAGVADDLQWRFERTPVLEELEDSIALRRTLTMGGTATLMCLLLWGSSLDADRTTTGRRGVAECVERQRSPETSAAFQRQVIDCAGAFFGRLEVSDRRAILHKLQSP